MYSLKQYALKKKIVLFFLFLFTVFIKYIQIIEKIYYINRIDMSYVLEEIILISIFVLIQLAARFTPFGRNWLTGDEEKPFMIVLDIMNAILMLTLIAFINQDLETGYWLWGTAILVALACLNLKRFLRDKNNYTGHVYSGVKFTLIVWIILDSANAASAVISIGCFLVAIACIVTGFVIKLEKLRVYGLVLSMICIVKLVMIDIAYSNTLGHAISFFISGLLCFTISAIYNYVGKKMKEE
jgi:uncharacterized membrane protein